MRYRTPQPVQRSTGTPRSSVPTSEPDSTKFIAFELTQQRFHRNAVKYDQPYESETAVVLSKGPVAGKAHAYMSTASTLTIYLMPTIKSQRNLSLNERYELKQGRPEAQKEVFRRRYDV
jgi:hypothetical protein